jgi:hypothetical protein
MVVILKYSTDDTEPESGQDGCLVLNCIYDDRKIEPVQEETELADKTTYPERDGFKRKLTVYLDPEQVEDNRDFLINMLGAQNVWAIGGQFVDSDDSALLCSIEDREYAVKFLDLVDSPLTFKSCKVFASEQVAGNDDIKEYVMVTRIPGVALDENGEALIPCTTTSTADKIFLSRNSGRSGSSIYVDEDTIAVGESFTIKSDDAVADEGLVVGALVF